jgi:uncharacterized protein
MRRKDKEITEISIMESILNEAEICRIGLSENDTPYIVPMNFAYNKKIIYLHSANEGKKIELLKVNNIVCFEIESKTSIVESENPCNWGMNYFTIIGQGKAFFIEDFAEKTKALNIIINKYAGKAITETRFKPTSESQLNRLAVIKILITEMTGKKSGNNL